MVDGTLDLHYNFYTKTQGETCMEGSHNATRSLKMNFKFFLSHSQHSIVCLVLLLVDYLSEGCKACLELFGAKITI